jgi:hypothetical protein
MFRVKAQRLSYVEDEYWIFDIAIINVGWALPTIEQYGLDNAIIKVKTIEIPLSIVSKKPLTAPYCTIERLRWAMPTLQYLKFFKYHL